MTEPTDHELLTRHARTGDEAAFAALVQRHVNLVWSAARRFTGDDTLAGEVTQAVFIILAQKAGRIGGKTILTGWLYQTARLTAANALKENRRRQLREHQAYMESKFYEEDLSRHSAATAEAWQQLAPVLDEAMHALRTADRDAVLLRYFENKSLADVGAALGVTEDAARVRVNRALDKLRLLLSKQGVVLGSTAIAAAVAANAVSAAPATLAASITTAVLTGTSLTLATIAMTTLQKIAVTAALTVTIGGGIYAAKQAHDARAEAQKLQAQQAPMAEQLRQMSAQHDKDTNMIAWLNEELAKNEKNNLELLKLRGEIGRFQQVNDSLLKNQAMQANALSSQSTNNIAAHDQEILLKQHATDAAGVILDAIRNYASENSGQRPDTLGQLFLSGNLKGTNFAGNITLGDFNFAKPGTTNFQGKEVLIYLRDPIRNPQGQSIMVEGGIDFNGSTFTELHNVSE